MGQVSKDALATGPHEREASQLRESLSVYIRRREKTVQDWSVNDWCQRANVSPSTLYNFLNNRSNSLTARTLGKLADAEGVQVSSLLGEIHSQPMNKIRSSETILAQPSEVGEFDTEIDAPERGYPIPARNPRDKRIDVIGVAVGGDGLGDFELNGNVVDRVPCPPALSEVQGAFALYVVGESMAPRFKPGETIFIHPHRPISRGDDVLVEMVGNGHDLTGPALIKEFVRRNDDHVVLRQHNPAKELRVPVKQVRRIYKIVPAGELFRF